MFNKGTTIVIAITGATIGVTGILGIDACFPDNIVGIVAKPEYALPEYLYWAIEHAKQMTLEQATQTTQPNINLRILDTITIPVPPLDEQRRIVAYLDGWQAKVNALREKGPLCPSDISPKGENYAFGVLCAKRLLVDIRWSVQKASPLGEVGGVGLAPVRWVDVDIVPEPFDKLRINSASAMPSVLERACNGELTSN